MTDSISLKAQVQKLKIIKAQDPVMVHVSLSSDKDEKINAIIVHKALTFMLDVEVGDWISVFGHYNARKQLIIERYLTNQKAKAMRLDIPDHLAYPHRKEFD